MNKYEISEDTLRALDNFLYSMAVWLNVDAKYAHKNSNVVRAKSELHEVRRLLMRDLKDDISRKVSTEQTVVGQSDTSGIISSSHEEERGEMESV